jgi:hypothetical protein
MKRFLMALAVAAVGAVTYVAAAPGSPQAAGPTARQFAALKRQVGNLQKQVKAAKNEADAGLGLITLCVMHKPVGVDQVGTTTSGYLFGPPQTAPTVVTATAGSALNLAPSTETSPQNKFYALNTSQPACVKLANLASTLSSDRSVADYAASR